jgi:hypothetical protein
MDMINLRELAGLLGDQIEDHLGQQADYQQGLECLVGFLLAQLQQAGYPPERLIKALGEEISAQVQADPDAPVLWPFLRLEAQLGSKNGSPVSSPGLPKALDRRFERLPGAPLPPLRVVPALPADTPTEC